MGLCVSKSLLISKDFETVSKIFNYLFEIELFRKSSLKIASHDTCFLRLKDGCLNTSLLAKRLIPGKRMLLHVLHCEVTIYLVLGADSSSDCGPYTLSLKWLLKFYKSQCFCNMNGTLLLKSCCCLNIK